MCRHYSGWAGVHAPTLTLSFAKYFAVQLLVVALPEELFFRGTLLSCSSRSSRRSGASSAAASDSRS